MPASAPKSRHRRAQRLLVRGGWALAAAGGAYLLLAAIGLDRALGAALADWSPLDTRIALTAALAAMACAVPGMYLLLRRQSMLGDALSHTNLLGIVLAFLAAQALRRAGWLTPEADLATRHAVMFGGAIVVGVLTAALTETVRHWGRVEPTAALGVVYTTLFAFGLLLIRAVADDVHIDPDCVLYGAVETAALDVVGPWGIPRAAVTNGFALALNLLLVALFFKELRISAFDPGLATAQGIPARVLHYGLMAATAVTLVAAFESVGSILVIAMLITPPATALLLADRMGPLLGLSLLAAAASAVLGHLLAIGLPAFVFHRLGFPTVVDASTAGMTAVAAALLFGLAWLFAPRRGLASRVSARLRIRVQIAAQDLLGLLYRRAEQGQLDPRQAFEAVRQAGGFGSWRRRLAAFRLWRAGQLHFVSGGYALSEAGLNAGAAMVRAHRLWESYLARHFDLPEDHLHNAAEWAEHFIGPELRSELAEELQAPTRDPHGRAIPGA